MQSSLFRRVAALGLFAMASGVAVANGASSTSSSSVGDFSESGGSSGSVGSDSFSRRSSGGEVAIKRILHFSDVHLNISESFDTNDSAEIPFAYGADAPTSLLISALEYAQQVLPDPDFFLYTGDHAVHGDPSEEYLAEAVKVNVATMTEYFSIVGNETLNVTAILGNSDTTPGYTMNVTDPDAEENPSIVAISGAWEASLTSSNLKDFNHRGYLSYDLDENLVVLTLNTVPYSPDHLPDTTDQPDPFEQFKWLNTSLLELRNSSKFAFIVGHIPPIIDSYSGSAMWNATYVEAYKQIVGDFSDVIKAQIFGHVHSIEFRLPLTADQASQTQDVVGSDRNDTGSSNLVPLFMSAAISPIFSNNPAFMIWGFDATTYELLDFAVYGTNISENSQELDWQLLFNATTAYGVSSLSWSEMNGFVERAAADPDLLEQYYYNSKAQSYQQSECRDTTCQAKWLCSFQWWSTAEDYAACVANGSFAASSAGTLTFALVRSLLYILLAIVAT